MQIQIFNISLADGAEGLSEMNRFLTGHKVLEVEQQFFGNANGGMWSFCVRYLPTANGGSASPFQSAAKEKVDYRQVLSEAEFAVFSRLRVIRKQLAAADAVPAYAVFTDEELAGISRLQIVDVETGRAPSLLLTVNGIGIKKVEKYGQQVLDLLNVETGHAPSSSLIDAPSSS